LRIQSGWAGQLKEEYFDNPIEEISQINWTKKRKYCRRSFEWGGMRLVGCSSKEISLAGSEEYALRHIPYNLRFYFEPVMLAWDGSRYVETTPGEENKTALRSW